MAETPSFNDFFAAIPVSQFPSLPRGLVTIPSDAKIVEAARVLADNNILCAPVRNVEAPDTAPWHQKYAGILDVVSCSRL
jgi:CBS domain-containing protein